MSKKGIRKIKKKEIERNREGEMQLEKSEKEFCEVVDNKI